MNAETVELLTKYGEHNPGCDPESQHNSDNCTCGFNAVSKQIMATYNAILQPATDSDAPEAGADRETYLESTLKQQAQMWAAEARAQASTVMDIYRELGIRKGDWNGAIPVMEKFDDLRADLAAEREAHKATQRDLDASKQYAESGFSSICDALAIAQDAKLPMILTAIESGHKHADALAQTLWDAADDSHNDREHLGDFKDCRVQLCKIDREAFDAHAARRSEGEKGAE